MSAEKKPETERVSPWLYQGRGAGLRPEGTAVDSEAGYSPAGNVTLLETFKALRKGASEEPSEKHPSLAERIVQAEPLAKAAPQTQKPLRIP